MPVAGILQPKPHGRRYTADRKAEILAYYDSTQNYHRTAAELGVPVSTVRMIVREREHPPNRSGIPGPVATRAEQLRASKRDNLSAVLGDVAWQALAQVQDQLPDASARDAAVVAGIVLQRKADLDGLPQRPAGDAINPALAGKTPEELRALRAALARPVQVVDALPLPAHETPLVESTQQVTSVE